MTPSHHDVEGLAAKLTEAQRKALTTNGHKMPDGWMPNFHHSTGRKLVDLGIVSADGWEFYPRLTPLGLALRSHLIGTGNG